MGKGLRGRRTSQRDMADAPGSRHEDEAEVKVAGAAEVPLSAHILALLNHLAGRQGSPRRGVRAGEWGSPRWRVPGQMGLLGPGLLIAPIAL